MNGLDFIFRRVNSAENHGHREGAAVLGSDVFCRDLANLVRESR